MREQNFTRVYSYMRLLCAPPVVDSIILTSSVLVIKGVPHDLPTIFGDVLRLSLWRLNLFICVFKALSCNCVSYVIVLPL